MKPNIRARTMAFEAVHGKTYEEIGARFNVNSQRVHQIVEPFLRHYGLTLKQAREKPWLLRARVLVKLPNWYGCAYHLATTPEEFWNEVWTEKNPAKEGYTQEELDELMEG